MRRSASIDLDSLFLKVTCVTESRKSVKCVSSPTPCPPPRAWSALLVSIKASNAIAVQGMKWDSPREEARYTSGWMTLVKTSCRRVIWTLAASNYSSSRCSSEKPSRRSTKWKSIKPRRRLPLATARCSRAGAFLSVPPSHKKLRHTFFTRRLNLNLWHRDWSAAEAPSLGLTPQYANAIHRRASKSSRRSDFKKVKKKALHNLHYNSGERLHWQFSNWRKGPLGVAQSHCSWPCIECIYLWRENKKKALFHWNSPWALFY